MFCGKCGSPIPDGNSFCAKCGTQVLDPSDLSSVQSVTQPIQTAPVIMMTQTAPKRANGAAITGLVFGIISICLCWIPYIGILLGLVGLILSIVGLCRKRACGSGAGQAITGLILSIICLFLGSILSLGIESYLNKAQAAAESQKAYQTTVDPNVDIVNAEIERVLG